MSPVRVQPNDGRRAGGSRPIDPKLYPVLNRRVFGLAHPKDIALLNALFHHSCARSAHDPNRPLTGSFKGLVVRPILFGLLGHQPHIGDTADGRRIKRPMLLAIFDNRLI